MTNNEQGIDLSKLQDPKQSVSSSQPQSVLSKDARIIELYTPKTEAQAPLEISDVEVAASSLPDVDQVSKLSLAVHTQQEKHLFGDQEAQLDGIITETMTTEDLRLLSKEESHFLGHRVEADSMFGQADADSGGEARISYALNGDPGYGPVAWVMPMADAISSGGMVQVFDRLDEPSLEGLASIGSEEAIGGLHDRGGEVGYFTPLGSVLNKNKMIENELEQIEAFKSMADAQRYLGYYCQEKGLSESYDDFSMRIFGKPLADISLEEFTAYLQTRAIRLRSEQGANTNLARELEQTAGTTLNNPTVLCLLPERLRDIACSRIDATQGLTEGQRTSLKRMMIGVSEDDPYAIHNLITTLSNNPGQFAEMILENMRQQMGDPDLTVEDVIKILSKKECQIGYQRFTHLQGGQSLSYIKKIV